MNVTEAFQLVDRNEFVYREDGSLIPQITADHGIQAGLELLDVQEGHRVLEIGTGSGYSTALLAHLVGQNGSVVSLDIEPD
jgi:protein-L-isoaspartate(D-aspartate) O-methyltransferase